MTPQPLELHLEGRELIFCGLAVQYFCMSSGMAASAMSGDRKTEEHYAKRKLQLSVEMTNMLTAEQAVELVGKIDAWVSKAAHPSRHADHHEAEAGASTSDPRRDDEVGGYL